MSIKIRANRFFDILAAGGLLLLLISISSNNVKAGNWGWQLIGVSFIGFFIYFLVKKRR